VHWTKGRVAQKGVANLFADRDVDYVQINSTTAGCFTFPIEPATANGE
jgi:hypothetical protein